jgi:hypothetical protein
MLLPLLLMAGAFKACFFALWWPAPARGGGGAFERGARRGALR